MSREKSGGSGAARRDSALRAELGEEIQAGQAAVDAFDEAVALCLGVNRTDLRCLEILAREGSVTPSVLGAGLGLTTGSVTAMLDRLERVGHLTRSPDPGDRRKVVVRATPEVLARVAELYGPIVERGGRMVAGYSDEEVRVVLGFLRSSRALYEAEIERVRGLPGAGRRRV
ncbi:MarR family winged helix-turn-helix transcriptional regulator [Streptosporangium saharense]|uniref:MarR family winged helix-turn-helix transcriptional regulator n=1 Tax=Streptosporangium saharense TaxID=1706840 RepID=UPI00332760F8